MSERIPRESDGDASHRIRLGASRDEKQGKEVQANRASGKSLAKASYGNSGYDGNGKEASRGFPCVECSKASLRYRFTFCFGLPFKYEWMDKIRLSIFINQFGGNVVWFLNMQLLRPV